jgi:hypothetical protein
MAQRSRCPDRPATLAAEQGPAPADAGDAQATPEVKPAPPEQNSRRCGQTNRNGGRPRKHHPQTTASLTTAMPT